MNPIDIHIQLKVVGTTILAVIISLVIGMFLGDIFGPTARVLRKEALENNVAFYQIDPETGKPEFVFRKATVQQTQQNRAKSRTTQPTGIAGANK